MHEAPFQNSQSAHPPGPVAMPTSDDDLATQRLAQLILMGMQQDIETQIDWRLQQRGVANRHNVSDKEVGLILGSIGIAIPLTAIAAASAGFWGILVVWIGLVLINMAWSLRR